MHTSKPDLAVLVDEQAVHGRGRGILFALAEACASETVNVMTHRARGIVGVALPIHRAYALGLSPQSGAIRRPNVPLFFNSVEAIECDETGISARERATTIRKLGDLNCEAAELVSPGHVMPCIAPDILDDSASLPEIALKSELWRGDEAAIAWCDILDATGETASTGFCLELAGQLGARLLLRRGVTAVEPAAIARLTGLEIGRDGLACGQFA